MARVGSQKPDFLDRVRPFADLRVRHEWDGRRGAENRNRERARLRVGANVNLGEQWRAGFRIRTGSPEDAQSPYHDMGRSDDRDMLGSWELNVDRAYLNYQPGFAPGLSITAGKFGHGFATNPVYGELVWDADANPEGLAAHYRLATGENTSVDLQAGQYLLVSDNDADEFSVFVAQAASRFKLGEGVDVQAALGWYRYGDTEPDDNSEALGHNSGNLATATGYVSDFHVLNPIVSVRTDWMGRPLTIAAEYILNTGADGDADGDEGFALGASFGRSRSRGDWQLFYQWQRIQQDAVFSPFAQDDFQFSTNFRGHVFGARYRLTDRIAVRAWGLVAQPESTTGALVDDDGARLRLDIDASF